MSSSIYEFILDINSRTETLLARIGASLGIDLVCFFQFTEGKQYIKYAWPKEPDSIYCPDKLQDFNIIANLPDVFSRLKSLMPFFDSPDSLPQKQSDYLKKCNITSAVFIPIQNKGDLWGCFCCMSLTIKHTWKSEDLSMLLKESIDLSSYIFLTEMLIELKEADEHLSLMLNLATEGILVSDENLIITSVSGRIAKLGGFAQEELLGRTIWDFIDPNDYDKARANLELVEKGLRSVDLYRLIMRSGTSLLTRISAKPLIKNGVKNGFVFLLVNIEAPTATEMRFFEYQEYMNYVSDLVWTTDMDLLFTYFSPSVEHLLGYAPDEALGLNAGLNYSESTHKNLAESFSKGLAAAKIKGRQFRTVLNVEQYRRDGRMIYGKAVIALKHNHEGTPTGFICVTHFRIDTPFPEYNV
jgi:PAS domain S-box-containing protein